MKELFGGRVALSDFCEGHIETTSNKETFYDKNCFAYLWSRYEREKRSLYSTTELLLKLVGFDTAFDASTLCFAHRSAPDRLLNQRILDE